MRSTPPDETRSLCPVCLRSIPATIVANGSDVRMRKTCPDHGSFEAVIWRGEPSYRDWDRPKIPWTPPDPAVRVDRGCPFDCGLCLQHRQQTCTALIEVTERCNLRCAYCFAQSGDGARPDPDMDEIRSLFESVALHGIPCNIQLSGGEPTVRDDLPEIVALGRSMGFQFIQVNTNGLRLAADSAYADSLKHAGLASIFLQFDGIDDNTYRTLRGASLFNAKVEAVRTCAEREIGVVLTPTIVPGVNDEKLGDIIRFAVDNAPGVRGVHFQPVSYFGRYPAQPSDADRITIPEIIRNLERQTAGLLKISDFGPPGCENARCSFHGSYVILPEGRLISFSGRETSCSCDRPRAEDGAAQTRRTVARQWNAPAREPCCVTDNEPSLGYWDVILERARTHTLTVSGMAFQDVWNVDLRRLQDCCIHVVDHDGRLIPFCAYNMTSAAGRSLYDRRGGR